MSVTAKYWTRQRVRCILVQLGRPSSLDLNLYETIKCTLASSDFVHMKTTEEDFVGRLPSRVAMAFRAAMGVLV